MDRTGRESSCSITVHLKQTRQVSGGGVLFEACRVGRVNESDGSIILNWDLGELNSARESVSYENITKKLSSLLYEDGESIRVKSDSDSESSGSAIEKRTAVTGPDGTCCFAGIEEGAWLIHASDSSSYGPVEDSLAAVPCYVQEGDTWTGPVYDAQIWPKGEIKTKETIREKQTETSSEKPQKDTEAPVKKTEKKQTPETEQHMDTAEEEPEKTKKPKKPEKSQPQTQTAPGITPVRTLDDTPLSAFICVFLSCALIIGLIVIRYRKRIMNRKNNIRSLILVSGCGMLLSGFAVMNTAGQEADPVQELIEGERKILFVNEAPDTPCLTVSKEVLDAENGSRAPAGDRFRFCLMLDNRKAAGVKYRIFNDEGVELVDLTGDGVNLVPAAGAASDPVSLYTKRDGSFFLCRGQYALFEDVSVGQVWEVTEPETDQYERLQPVSSGTVSGTIERDGSSARFVNQYDPDPDPGFSQGILEITKRILWPEGVALPFNGPFSIRVLADNEPLCNVPLDLYDQSGNGMLQHERTDENGIFEIRGGQRAVISGIPSGSDLLVEEIDDPEDAFVPSGDVLWKGASSPRQKITFTNRLADFVVSKKAPSDDDGHRFLFSLLDSGNRPMSGVSYFLVKEDGTFSQSQPLQTDSGGHFTLASSERAVFTGMEEGSRYSVLEERILGYRQVIPDDPDGYRDQIVRNGVKELHFENEKTNVRMFVPATGGEGIIRLLLLAVAGMGGCCLAHLLIYRRERILSAKKQCL